LVTGRAIDGDSIAGIGKRHVANHQKKVAGVAGIGVADADVVEAEDIVGGDAVMGLDQDTVLPIAADEVALSIAAANDGIGGRQPGLVAVGSINEDAVLVVVQELCSAGIAADVVIDDGIASVRAVIGFEEDAVGAEAVDVKALNGHA